MFSYFAGKTAKEILGKILPFAGVALLFGALIMLAFCSGEKSGGNKEIIGQQERTIELDGKVTKADEKASSDRTADQKRLNEQQKELEDANTEQNPDDRRTKRGCLIMRQQGRDTSEIPGCN